jgi:hypothetical protein
VDRIDDLLAVGRVDRCVVGNCIVGALGKQQPHATKKRKAVDAEDLRVFSVEALKGDLLPVGRVVGCPVVCSVVGNLCGRPSASGYCEDLVVDSGGSGPARIGDLVASTRVGMVNVVCSVVGDVDARAPVSGYREDLPVASVEEVRRLDKQSADDRG